MGSKNPGVENEAGPGLKAPRLRRGSLGYWWDSPRGSMKVGITRRLWLTQEEGTRGIERRVVCGGGWVGSPSPALGRQGQAGLG